nr:MAG TPA: hypothetical protein [Caudoviricetes sp.]
MLLFWIFFLSSELILKDNLSSLAFIYSLPFLIILYATAYILSITFFIFIFNHITNLLFKPF